MNHDLPFLKSIARILFVAQVVLLSTCSKSSESTKSALSGVSITYVYDFDNDEIGKTPPGFTTSLTGGGEAIRWEVQETPTAPSGNRVVAQLSDDKTDIRYPVMVQNDLRMKNLNLAVKFKTISGEVDASGGLVFRYLDKDNYYIVRANSLENNVVAYKTENGKRSNIGTKTDPEAYGAKAEVLHNKWNSLRVIARDKLFEVFLNDKKLFEVENSAFDQAGRIGLWTKADAVTQFDDLTIVSLDDVSLVD